MAFDRITTFTLPAGFSTCTLYGLDFLHWMDNKSDAFAAGVVYPQKKYGQIALISGPNSIPVSSTVSPRTESTGKRLSSADRRPLRSSPLAGPSVIPPHKALVQSDDPLNLKVPFRPPPARVAPERRASDTHKVPVHPLPPAKIVPERRRASDTHVVRFATFRVENPRSPKPDSNSPSGSRSSASVLHRTYYTPPPSSYPIEKLPPSPQFVATTTDRPSVLRKHFRSVSQPHATPSPPSPAPPATSHLSRSTSTSKSEAHRTAASPKSPQSGFDNWMAANTYATIPRFSRLNMNASNVVLPMSAREYKQMSMIKKAKLEETRTAKLEEAKKAKLNEAKKPRLETTKKPKSEPIFKKLRRKKATESLRPSVQLTASNTNVAVEDRPPSSSSSATQHGTVSSHTSTLVAADQDDGRIKGKGIACANDSRSTSPTTFYSCESCESRLSVDDEFRHCSMDGIDMGLKEERANVTQDHEEQHRAVSNFWRKLTGVTQHGSL